MEGFLRAETSTLTDSPSSSYLADEVASICPLITPSPPTNDLINPPPEPTEPSFVIGEALATQLQHVQDEDKADTASSSSSALAEPACAQLLNHRNVYHHMIENDKAEAQDINCKAQSLQLTFRNPPGDYFFMSWNWPLIRRLCMWFFLSGLVAMVALVIAMISSLPKTCNPPMRWYQGTLLYEIFPASFFSSRDLMQGDFRGISAKAAYLQELGVRGVRLNSIFNTTHYPRDYEEISSLVDVAPSLGDLHDFRKMTDRLRSRNISVILDLPVHPFVKRLARRRHDDAPRNGSAIEFFRRPLRDDEMDTIEDAILHWVSHGVDGFYLKGLERLVDDPNLAASMRAWKRILGPERIVIVSEEFAARAAPATLDDVDLVDVRLDLSRGITAAVARIVSVQNGTLFRRAGAPWAHWSLGGVDADRLADVLPHSNATLGATLLQMMLPGTPSIFYGDEVGLRGVVGEDGDDAGRLRQLGRMPWPGHRPKVLPWNHGREAPVDFRQAEVVRRMAALRAVSPSIYMNTVCKEGATRANAEIKYADGEFLVMQRWYPRRKAFVVASNLGDEHLSTDLSTLLYSGDIVVGPNMYSKPSTITFKNVSLWPGESVVIVLN